MPTICTYANCRKRAPRGPYCSAHKSQVINTNNTKCTHVLQQRTITKNMCQVCYTQYFPNDPLTFQLTYKSAFTATVNFIQNRFDGFVANQIAHTISMNLNGITLIICFSYKNKCTSGLTNVNGKTQYVYFGVGKYWNSKLEKYMNPMLYTRLYELEAEINKCIEFILTGMTKEPIYLFCNEVEDKLDAMNFSK